MHENYQIPSRHHLDTNHRDTILSRYDLIVAVFSFQNITSGTEITTISIEPQSVVGFNGVQAFILHGEC